MSQPGFWDTPEDANRVIQELKNIKRQTDPFQKTGSDLKNVEELLELAEASDTDILNQMGADIVMADPHRVIVRGPSSLHGKKIYSPDIRAGMALVIAALLAKGQSQIDNIYQIDRGYDKIDERLRALGADIKRVKS